MEALLDAQDTRVSASTSQVLRRLVIVDPAQQLERDFKRRPQFIAGNLKWQTTLVCLHCGMGKEMCDLTSTQVAGYCFQHLRTHKDNQCDEAPLSLVTKLMRSWSGLKEGERTPQQPCPVIWDAKVVDEWFSDAVKATFVEKELHICMNCLRIRKPKLVCCKDMEIKRMNGKKVLGSHATLIMDSPKLQLQASLARIEARSRRAVIEDMPLRANSPVQARPTSPRLRRALFRSKVIPLKPARVCTSSP